MLKKKGSEQLDIIFEAGEDLLNFSKNQVIMIKNNSIKLPITRPRTFLSYSLEFCGITSLNYKMLRFQSLGRDIRPETSIMTACLVKVIHTTEFSQMAQNPLKTSFYSLFNHGSHSDVLLQVNDEQPIPLHKCILACRSPKFHGMFSSDMLESNQAIVKVQYKKPDLYKLMLQWIYCGYWKEFPVEISDACDLMLLADEYLIMDLKQKCEEDIISKLNSNNILEILLFVEQHSNIVSSMLLDKTNSMFIDDFDRIHKMNPNLEKEITQVPGLITKLFLNLQQRKIRKGRKVHFVVEDYENQESDSDDYVLFGNTARQQILKGVQQVNKAAILTLGPQGRNVIIESETGNNRCTKDGVTVVKNIFMQNRLSEIGAALIRNSSNQTNKFAGDGTTTSALIASTIFQQGQKYISDGYNPIYITRGLKEAQKKILEYLEEIKTQQIDDQLLYNVAQISSNYDKQLTQIVFQAIKEIGINGIVTIEPGGIESKLNIQQGIHILRGYIHEQFADKGSTKCILNYPYILTIKQSIQEIKQILPLLELIKQTNQPLFIIATDISESVMSQLLYNHTKDIIKVCAITIPGMGQTFQNDIIDDFSILCNSQSIDDINQIKSLQQLGQAVKIEIDNIETMIIGTQPNEEQLEQRKNIIKQQLEQNQQQQKQMILKDRLNRFDGKSAIVYIGGQSEIEMHENRDKLVDSLNATKSILKYGILPGGGSALLHASKLLNYLEIEQEYQLGVKLLQQTLQQPIKQLCINAGINYGQIINTILNENDYNFGYDQKRQCFGNMIDLGVIDSFNVIKHSLTDGISLGSMLLTTEVAIVLDKQYNPTSLSKYKKEVF